jgi:hypothetical protein
MSIASALEKTRPFTTALDDVHASPDLKGTVTALLLVEVEQSMAG